jgi:predicted P-loop ATPase
MILQDLPPQLPPLPALDAPLVDWARFYAALGWPVFPCKGKLPVFPAAHKRGDPLRGKCKGECGRTGHGFYDATLDLKKIDVWFWGSGLNIGTPTGRGRSALDVDPRNGGDETLRELERTYGPLPRTWLVHTGGGGEHHYFKDPPQGFKSGKIDLGPGLDVQNEGHYCLLPPSIHPDTGNRYVWEPDYSPDCGEPANLPEWLVALMTAVQEEEGKRRASSSKSRVDPKEPILEGTREASLMSIGGAMRRVGATQEGIRAALEAENQRCVPPLEPTDLDRLAASLSHYDPEPPPARLIVRPPGVNGTPAALDGHQQNNPAPELPAAFDLSAFLVEIEKVKAGSRRKTILSAIDRLATAPLAVWVEAKAGLKALAPDLNLNDLERLRTQTLHEAQARTQQAAQAARPPWQKALFYDKEGLQETDNNLQAIFANDAYWHNRLWWDAVANRAYLDDQQPLDIHYVRNEVISWLATAWRLPVRRSERILEVMRSWAYRHQRDPLQEYLNTLPASDPTDPERTLLNTWLHIYGGAEDTAYTRFVSRILPVSLVKRAMKPGCQYRYVVVLEGAENLGKTKLLRILGGRWHQEFPRSVEGKESYMQLQGYWLVELGELDALRPAEQSRVKMFISQQMDVWIPKYQNDPTERPRRAILVGTTNEREYLKGQHGDTRFFPLWLEGPVEHEALTQVRDRLFTQAKHFLAEHPEDWWVVPEDVQKEVEQEREERREPSVYEDALRPFVLQRHTCTNAEALEALHIPQDRWSKGLQMEVAKALKGLGWYRHVVRDASTKRVTRFWADTPQKKEEAPL